MSYWPTREYQALRKPFSQSAKPQKSQAIYRNILFKILAPSKVGRLTFLMPDGSSVTFGAMGNGPDARIRVHDTVLFKKVVLYGDIGFGESYVDGDWDSESPDSVIAWFILNKEHWPAISGTSRKFSIVNFMGFANRLLHELRPNNVKGSRKNIQAHYDLSNDFFRTFLDPTMTYSCAYFETPDQGLEGAQIAKYDRLCRKLRLKSSDRLLEIGSGWGGFAVYAAKNYGCAVTTVTISEEQRRFAQDRIRQEGLENNIQVQLRDYRKVTGRFDKIVSIEMLEAVGEKYLDLYFAKCHELLKKDGLLGIQVITCPDSRFESFRKNVDWIQKHIFPGSLLPSLGRIQQALHKTGDLMVHDLEDMGLFYAKTLSLWQETFQRNVRDVQRLGMDRRFINKWNFYLHYCKAAFATRNISVVQAIYTRPNNWLLSEPAAAPSLF